MRVHAHKIAMIRLFDYASVTISHTTRPRSYLVTNKPPTSALWEQAVREQWVVKRSHTSDPMDMCRLEKTSGFVDIARRRPVGTHFVMQEFVPLFETLGEMQVIIAGGNHVMSRRFFSGNPKDGAWSSFERSNV